MREIETMSLFRWELIEASSLEIVATISENGEVRTDDELLSIWLKDKLSFPVAKRWSKEINSKIFEFAELVYPSMPEHTDIVMFELWLEIDYLLRRVSNDEVLETPPTAWERAREHHNKNKEGDK